MLTAYSASELLEILRREIPPDGQLVFDCDGTLIDGDISSLTGWKLMQGGLVDQQLVPEPFRSPLFYTKMTLLDYDRVRDHVLQEQGDAAALEWELYIQSGLPENLVVDCADQVLRRGLAQNWVRFTDILPEWLRQFRERSWIVSGSSRPTVMAVAEYLGLARHRVLATQLEELDGIYQKKFSPEGFVWEEKKVAALNAHAVKNIFLVAGDSPGDWPMMLQSQKWIWCALGNNTHYREKAFRKLIADHVGESFYQEIPQAVGLYAGEWQNRFWVFEIKGTAL